MRPRSSSPTARSIRMASPIATTMPAAARRSRANNRRRLDMADDKGGMTGRDLQDSQSGGGSGDFGGNMDQQQRAGQAGGGAGPSAVSNGGGTSGTGGYGRSQKFGKQQGHAA